MKIVDLSHVMNVHTPGWVGYAGNKIQQNMQNNDTYTTTERRCETVTDTHQKLIGYDVTYKLGDETGKVRMDREPGERIPVKDGKLVLGPSEDSAG